MSSGVSGTRSGGAGKAAQSPNLQQATNPAVPATLQKYSAYDPNEDYNHGIPYAFKQQLRADGYEMDASAVMEEAMPGANIMFLDVRTGETAVYNKKRVIRQNDRTGNDYMVDVYTRKKGSVDEVGGQKFEVTYGHIFRMMNGVVAKEVTFY